MGGHPSCGDEGVRYRQSVKLHLGAISWVFGSCHSVSYTPHGSSGITWASDWPCSTRQKGSIRGRVTGRLLFFLGKYTV